MIQVVSRFRRKNRMRRSDYEVFGRAGLKQGFDRVLIVPPVEIMSSTITQGLPRTEWIPCS